MGQCRAGCCPWTPCNDLSLHKTPFWQWQIPDSNWKISHPAANPVLQESSRQNTVEYKGEVIFFSLTHPSQAPHPAPWKLSCQCCFLKSVGLRGFCYHSITLECSVCLLRSLSRIQRLNYTSRYQDKRPLHFLLQVYYGLIWKMIQKREVRESSIPPFLSHKFFGNQQMAA